MTNRYKIVTANDGIHWVSLQPLLADVKEQMDTDMVKNNPQVYASVESVKVFLEALVSEGNYNQYKSEQAGNVQ